MTVALVPMKDMGKAKQRLSPILSDAERRDLVTAMLRDVLIALRTARNIERVVIVAHDRGYLEFEAEVIEEAVNNGYNEAIGFALTQPAFADADAILIVPGDVPAVTADEIDALSAPATAPTIRIAAARDGDGTNGLAIAPPDLMQTAFGIGSFERHKKAAETTGAGIEIIAGPGIAFDIDTPEDLIAFCAVDGTGETHTFLYLSGIRRRLLAEKA